LFLALSCFASTKAFCRPLPFTVGASRSTHGSLIHWTKYIIISITAYVPNFLNLIVRFLARPLHKQSFTSQLLHKWSWQRTTNSTQIDYWTVSWAHSLSSQVVLLH
jgi:hypothetical protein